MTKSSRRDFLKTAGAFGALSAIGGGSALASGSGYQALVCIFLAGGNDSHNMVIPISTAKQSYGLYAQGRQSLALPQSSLLSIGDGSDHYGLHPLMPEIQSLYSAGNAAVIANVGMLMKPITRQAYLANSQANVPVQLFSHSDQVNQWQSAIPDGSATAGWGGLVEDSLASLNAGAAFSPITSTSGCGLFCSGLQTFPATIPVGGATSLIGATGSRLSAVQNLMAFDNGLKLVQTANNNLNHGVGFSQALTAALASATIHTPFPNTLLGQQLQTVAKIMSIRGVLGIQRQVFFCQLGGFDTHSLQAGTLTQPGTQDLLLQQLSQAVGQFYTATQEVGTDLSTVTFTASEFGRTLQPNGNAGTDHAWGGHHFVIGRNAASGGPLKGGKFYGQFPLLALGGPDDANSRGTLIPTTSVDQYAATMAQWFGLASGSVGGIFKFVGNFPTSDLGFLA